MDYKKLAIGLGVTTGLLSVALVIVYSEYKKYSDINTTHFNMMKSGDLTFTPQNNPKNAAAMAAPMKEGK